MLSLYNVVYTKGDLINHNAIAAVVYDDKKRILMQDHVKYNCWTIPVGKVDEGDTIEGTLIKEVQEECGITPTKYREITSYLKNYKRDNNLVRVNAHIFEVLEYKGKIRNLEPQKHRSFKFMTISEIKKLDATSDLTKVMIKYFDRK